tara:strand:+ start:3706 stop:3885 length:180 start_codon:yes stop_codon:yes gene_type:complete
MITLLRMEIEMELSILRLINPYLIFLVCFSKTDPNVMKVLSVLLTRRTFDEQAKKTSQP